MGQSRNCSKEFKLEAVNLVVMRGVSVAQACRDLDVSENVMRRWIREFRSSEGQAFRGHGVQKPNDAELTRLRREVLDAYIFSSLEQVREITEEWIKDYNEDRPHTANGKLPPVQNWQQPKPAEMSPIGVSN